MSLRWWLLSQAVERSPFLKNERTESVLEESAEVRVAREDDVSDVLEKLRDGDGS